MRCCFDLSVSLNFVADCTSCTSFLLGGSELAGGVWVHLSVVGKPQLIRKMYVNLESRLRRQRDSESATRFVFRDRP